MSAAVSTQIRIDAGYKQEDLYDLCEINGSLFAIFNKAILGQNIELDCGDYNVILLQPLQAHKNITIQAITVIALSRINARNGTLTIESTNKCIVLGAKLASKEPPFIQANGGVYEFDVSREVRQEIVESFTQAFTKKKSEESGPLLVEGLATIFGAIQDRMSGEESDQIRYADALKFFNVEIRKEAPPSSNETDSLK